MVPLLFFRFEFFSRRAPVTVTGAAIRLLIEEVDSFHLRHSSPGLLGSLGLPDSRYRMLSVGV